MSTSLSNLAINLFKGLHNDRCIDCKSYLDYMTTEDEQLFLRCFCVKRVMKKTLIKN